MRFVFHIAGFDRILWRSAWFGACMLLMVLGVGQAHAQQFEGFRYRDGKCVNDEGEEGRNSGYIGECGALRARDLRDANLVEVDLSGANMHSVEAQGVKLQDAKLIGVEMKNAKFESADLRGADLTDAVADRADLRRADLTGANLTDVRLQRAILFEAVLRDANLSNADLRRADLRGADLSYADFTRANVRGATFNSQTIFSPTFPLYLAQSRGMVYRQ